MKIHKNHLFFRAFNRKIERLLTNHSLLAILNEDEKSDYARIVVDNYFDFQFHDEVTDEGIKAIVNSITLPSQVLYVLEEDGKIMDYHVVFYSLKVLAYRKLVQYLSEGKKANMKATG